MMGRTAARFSFEIPRRTAKGAMLRRTVSWLWITRIQRAVRPIRHGVWGMLAGLKTPRGHWLPLVEVTVVPMPLVAGLPGF